MLATTNGVTPTCGAQPLPTAEAISDAMAMLCHSRPGPTSGLKRCLEIEIDRAELRHRSILDEAGEAFVSREEGIV